MLFFISDMKKYFQLSHQIYFYCNRERLKKELSKRKVYSPEMLIYSFDTIENCDIARFNKNYQ